MNESLKPNHFEGMDENQQVNPQDQQIDLADVDPDAFEFPKQNDPNKRAPSPNENDTLDPRLLTT